VSSRIIILLSLVLLAILAGTIWIFRLPLKQEPATIPQMSISDADLPDICRKITFENVVSIVCEVDLRSHHIDLSHADASGKVYGSLNAFLGARPPNERPVLAMNAGMYEPDLSPVGLYVEEGRKIANLRTDDGKGNFFLKPNGVFFIGKNDVPGILEAGAFARILPEVRIATQSGPMLVINGSIHPRFEPDGTSRFIRNGIGIRDANTIVLAISIHPVSFGSFARLFKDELNCANALYFDGAISALSNDRKTLIGGADPVGPIIAVVERR
jgi:uncharacterized protein YigE (DUF2233 family)